MSADDPTYGDEPDDELIAEARWPMAGAVLAAMVLTILLPNDFRHFPVWLLPVLEGGLLLAVILGDPGQDRSPLQRAAWSVLDRGSWRVLVTRRAVEATGD